VDFRERNDETLCSVEDQYDYILPQYIQKKGTKFPKLSTLVPTSVRGHLQV